MATTDSSPVVRLYLASAMQRIDVERRWEVLTALAGHADDKDDANLPLLIWYALEPGVGSNAARALQMVKEIKIPRLATFLARRIAGGNSAKPPAKFKPVKVAPSASVSPEGLTLWFQANGVVTDRGGQVSQWTDGLRNGRHAVQSNTKARPTLMKSLKGRAALKFDGDDDHLVVPHESALSFRSTDNFTVAMWVYIESRQEGWRGIATKSRDGQPWYGAWIEPSGKWVFGATNANLAGPRATVGWHHVSIVQDGAKDQRLLYVDGLLVGRDAAKDGTGTGDLWIAGAKSTEEYFSGALSELRLYRRALSHPEIAHLAQP